MMDAVRNESDVEARAAGAIQSLYGKNITDLRIRSLFSLPNEQRRESWDAQTTFILNNIQYVVDLTIREQDGIITNARLIDVMKPL
jgi:hypothetical protein